MQVAYRYRSPLIIMFFGMKFGVSKGRDSYANSTSVLKTSSIAINNVVFWDEIWRF
jgi:hypothetical protein